MEEKLFEIDPVPPGKICQQCAWSERHKYSTMSIYYCSLKNSNRTVNGMLKIKARDRACNLFKDEVKLEYFYDDKRHLVCKPYSVENLHLMARRLRIKRHFYHERGIMYHPHYDIPKNMDYIKTARPNEMKKVSRFEILRIIKSALNG